VSQNRVLKRIFRLRREELKGEWRNCLLWSFIILIFKNVYYRDGMKEAGLMGRACMCIRKMRNAFGTLL
jgi:hypothetical protein